MGNQKLGNVALGIIHPAKAIEVRAQQKAAQQQLDEARRLRQQSLDLAGKLNWQPNYVSDAIKPYQRAQSPVARAFLESLLTGSNPAAVQSTRLGADRQKAAAQGAFNQQFGGWDQLEAQQRQIEQETPWAVTPPQTPVQTLPQSTQLPPKKTFSPQAVKAFGDAGYQLDPYSGLPTKLSPYDYQRYTDALAAGDRDSAQRIFSGRG